jgi:hypothetical protein
MPPKPIAEPIATPLPYPEAIPAPTPVCDPISYPPDRMPPSTPPGPRAIPKPTTPPYFPTRIFPLKPPPPPEDECERWEKSLQYKHEHLKSKFEVAAWWAEYLLYFGVCGPFNVSDPPTK